MWIAMWVAGLAIAGTRGLGAVNGWGGLTWGSTPAEDMSCTADDLLQTCRRPADQLVAGAVALDDVSYAFFGERLMEFTWKVRDGSRAAVLHDWMEAEYGRSTLTNGRPTWENERVHVEVEREDGGAVTVRFTYRPIHEDFVAASAARHPTAGATASVAAHAAEGVQYECTAINIRSSSGTGPSAVPQASVSDRKLNTTLLPAGWTPIGAARLDDSAMQVAICRQR